VHQPASQPILGSGLAWLDEGWTFGQFSSGKGNKETNARSKNKNNERGERGANNQRKRAKRTSQKPKQKTTHVQYEAKRAEVLEILRLTLID
jgi:hypothetical protein